MQNRPVREYQNRPLQLLMDLMEMAEEKGNTKLAAIYWANAKRIYGEEVDEVVQR